MILLDRFVIVIFFPCPDVLAIIVLLAVVASTKQLTHDVRYIWIMVVYAPVLT